MKRGRSLKGFERGSSSEDEDDAFAAISKKQTKIPRLTSLCGGEEDVDKPMRSADSSTIKNIDESVATETSSSKRHHHVNAARQAKMNALLEELQSTKPTEPVGSDAVDYGSIQDGENFYGPGSMNHRPQKMGSYVEPGQEHLTTNIFVGNLDPCSTEEELTDVFRQFGDLYSVKIMWPRTAEERSRNRNTGFVCFMTRKDAEDAMDAYCDADPLETGRRMLLRWGKNVKKTVRFGTGGVPTNLRKKPRAEKVKGESGGFSDKHYPSRVVRIDAVTPMSAFVTADVDSDCETLDNHSASAPSISFGQTNAEGETQKQLVGPIYDPFKHSSEAIIVNAPTDPRRAKFITTVASFVAKDGSIFESKLIEAQSSNPDFQFLLPRRHDISSSLVDYDSEYFAEHIFYRWRVYSFAQGDGLNSWRTTPFVMIEPHGRFWIPPPLNKVAAQEEEEAQDRREQDIIAAQEERRKLSDENDYTTGRQIERAKFTINAERKGGVKLNDWEKEKYHDLLHLKLCATQESICEAMAFTFDKSGAAIELSEILKDALLESDNGISVDTRIARLYLLSDILFNSQQPGVRNAFQFRDAIEAMSPEVFESLGKHGDGRAGRMTMNKLRMAVSSVLSAWTNWSVYNTTFLDELESRFEGRDISAPKFFQEDENGDVDDNTDIPAEEYATNDEPSAVSMIPRGEWTSSALDDVDGQDLDDVDGEALEDDDVVGDELEQVDGEELDGEDLNAIEH